MEMAHILKALFLVATAAGAAVGAVGGPCPRSPCPAGLHFGAASPRPNPKPRACPPPGPGALILYPHPTDCSKFLICDNQHLVDMECPTGLHFNPDLDVCDTPSNAGCEKTSTSHHYSFHVVSILGFVSLFLSNICPPAGEGDLVLFPHPRNCSQFIVCDNGHLMVMSCPQGMHFNPESHVCDFPSQAGCKHSSILKPTVASKAAGGSEACSLSSADLPVVLPDPKNCSQYLLCDNGKLVVRPCPPALAFNPVAKVCDYPSHAGCTAARKHISSPASHAPSICPPSGEGDLVLLPDSKNCSQYIVCDNGQMTSLPCPPGLHFSADLQVCVLPTEAGCTPANKRYLQ